MNRDSSAYSDVFQAAKDDPIFSKQLQEMEEDVRLEHELTMRNWIKTFQKVFCGDADGRKVLWWLVHETHLFRPFGGQNANAYALEGKRELGLDVSELIGAEKMLEALIEVRNDNIKLEKANDN